MKITTAAAVVVKVKILHHNNQKPHEKGLLYGSQERRNGQYQITYSSKL
jgi:hypothetical protein